MILGSEARLSYIKDFASLIPFYLEGGGGRIFGDASDRAVEFRTFKEKSHSGFFGQSIRHVQ